MQQARAKQKNPVRVRGQFKRASECAGGERAGGRACDGVATKASASRATLAEVRDNETRFLVRRIRLFVLVRR